MAKSNFISVPFKADGSDGLYEVRGIGKFSSAGLIIEYEAKLLGLFGKEVKEVRFGLEDIVDVKFKKGFFKFFSRIHIRINNVAKFGSLPNKSGKFVMSLKREDFELGERAVQYLNSFLLPEDFDRQISGMSPVDKLIEGDKYKTNDLRKTRKLDE